MVLSQPSPVSFNPVAPQPILTAEPKTPPMIPQQLPTTPADQVDLSTSVGGIKPTPATSKPSAPDIRFGNGNQAQNSQSTSGNKKKSDGFWHGVKSFIKTASSWTLGAASGLGLAIGVPLGLLQMAVGIVIHPLLITGALTMALPILGLIGAYFLGKK